MTAQAIFQELLECGIDLDLMPDGKHLSVPANCLTQMQRDRVKAHRQDLIALLSQSRQITEELLVAAMRACDHWGDSPEAREQMRIDCLKTPAHLRVDLLAHFKANYRHT